MYNPRNINLYLENELPPSRIGQSGGNININLINNKTHKYIRAENKITTYIYGAPKVEEDVQLWFEFNNEYMITDDKHPNLYYIERGNNSISFNIKQLKKYSNVAIKDMPNYDLTLKLIDLTYKDLNAFIEEWKSHKVILENSVPHIYMYGELYTKDNEFISYYYITKKYKNHMELLKLDYNFTINYIIKMLIFLEKCSANNITLRNFKFSGLGFDFINYEINFVFLDYNDTTLIKSSDNYFKLFSDGCDAMCAGTLIPYFIISDFFEMNANWTEKLDKLYIVGLAETLIFLLYNQDEIMEKLFKMLYNPSYLKPCLHYYHYMKLFDDKNNKKTFMDLFNSIVPKFVELDPKLINPMFKRIIINCFETTYNSIKSPIVYLNNLKEVFNEYEQIKAGIKTHIKPIDSINPNNQIIPRNPIINEEDETKLQEDTFIKDKIKTSKKLLDKSERFEDSDLHDLNTKFELSKIKEQYDTKKDIITDNISDSSTSDESDDIEELQKIHTGETELKELEDFIDSDDIIPVKPYTQRPEDEHIRPILKHHDLDVIKPKKVSFNSVVPKAV